MSSDAFNMIDSMNTMTLAQWPTWATGGLLVFFIVVSVFMVLAILIQKPQGGGLAGAFGGGTASSGQTAFGTKTGDALTVFTVIVFFAFLVVAVMLNISMKPDKAATGTTASGTTPANSSTAPATEQTPAPQGDQSASPVTTPVTTPANETSPGTPLTTPATTPATTPETQPTPPSTPPSTPPQQPANPQ